MDQYLRRGPRAANCDQVERRPPLPAAHERRRAGMPKKARLKGALFRSQTYGRKKIGFDRAAGAKDGRCPVRHLAINEVDEIIGQPKRQTRRAETVHLFDAFGIHALAGLLPAP